MRLSFSRHSAVEEQPNSTGYRISDSRGKSLMTQRAIYPRKDKLVRKNPFSIRRVGLGSDVTVAAGQELIVGAQKMKTKNEMR
ncbi:hypothetical protein EV2_008105 [Malus domestica]